MKTPGFPKDYTSALVRDCFWKIIAPRGHLVRLEFITFQIRVSDRVKISYDWNWWYPWYIYRLTPWHSFTVYSTGRQLGVQLFGADEVDDGVGFLANYTMVPAGGMKYYQTVYGLFAARIVVSKQTAIEISLIKNNSVLVIIAVMLCYLSSSDEISLIKTH